MNQNERDQFLKDLAQVLSNHNITQVRTTTQGDVIGFWSGPGCPVLELDDWTAIGGFGGVYIAERDEQA